MSKTLLFFRHAEPKIKKSDYKKGVKFLGRKDNPTIIIPSKEKIDRMREELNDSDVFFSSSMRRCVDSISLLTNKNIIETPLLLEIKYGDVDGMFLNDIKEKYPYLFENWKKGDDIQFPNGENNLDVILRVKSFIKSVKNLNSDNIAVCTHNVFLRCLIGSSLRIPVKEWYKIEIPYFEPIKFNLSGEKLIYMGETSQLDKMLKNISSKKFNTYFIALLPEKELFLKMYYTKKDIFNKFGEQKYLKDPPHSTLYLFPTDNIEEVKKRIQKISSKEKKIKFNVSKEYVEFKGDKFAGGGTSLGLKFDKNANKRITLLQKNIINYLNDLRREKIPERYTIEGISNIQLLDNIKAYGFPFVGDILIPHLAFCCFDNQEKTDIFKKEHPIKEFIGSFNFTKLGLFKLSSYDKAELVKSFDLQ